MIWGFEKVLNLILQHLLPGLRTKHHIQALPFFCAIRFAAPQHLKQYDDKKIFYQSNRINRCRINDKAFQHCCKS